MATRRVIKSVLSNFLGTYTSRYSDFNGYWLFGFIVENLRIIQIDLLKPVCHKEINPLNLAIEIATHKFTEQLQKNGLARSQIKNAQLTIERLTGEKKCWINRKKCIGIPVRFCVMVKLDNDNNFSHYCIIIIANHNPLIEFRRGNSLSAVA